MIDYDILISVRDKLLSTSDSVEQACESLAIDPSLTEDIEAELNQWIERCPDCDWWVEVGELADDDGNQCCCSECRS